MYIEANNKKKSNLKPQSMFDLNNNNRNLERRVHFNNSPEIKHINSNGMPNNPVNPIQENNKRKLSTSADDLSNSSNKNTKIDTKSSNQDDRKSAKKVSSYSYRQCKNI